MVREARRVIRKTDIARGYITENIFKKDRLEIIQQVIKDTGLRYSTIQKLYMTIWNEKAAEEIDKIEFEKREVKMYKGRPRSFFRFNTNNLWRK